MSKHGPALRVIGLIRLREAGATWDACGAAFGVSGPRAFAILRRWLISDSSGDEWADMQRKCAAARKERDALHREVILAALQT